MAHAGAPRYLLLESNTSLVMQPNSLRPYRHIGLTSRRVRRRTKLPDPPDDHVESLVIQLRHMGFATDDAQFVASKMEAHYGYDELARMWRYDCLHEGCVPRLKREAKHWLGMTEEEILNIIEQESARWRVTTEADLVELRAQFLGQQPEGQLGQSSAAGESAGSCCSDGYSGDMGRGKGRGSQRGGRRCRGGRSDTTHVETVSSIESMTSPRGTWDDSRDLSEEASAPVDISYVNNVEQRLQMLERVMVLVDFEKLLSAADKAAERTADLDPCLKALPLTQTAAPCVYDLAMDDEVYDGFYQFTGENPGKAKRSGARRRRRRTRGRSPRPPE